MRYRALSTLPPLLTLWAASIGLAQGLVIAPEPIPDHRRPGQVTTTPLTTQSLRVSAEIVDGVAVTIVHQSFINPLSRTVEGTYVFPLPDDVAVGDFEMTLNGKTLRGEVLEKIQARQTYEAIVRRARDPALLEYLNSRLYQASIFPIPAGERLDVKLQYSQTLAEQNGLGLLRHPLRVSAQAGGTIGSLALNVKIRGATPLTSVFCPTHPCMIARPSDREATISYEQSSVQPERDFVIYYQRQNAALGLSVLTYRSAGEPGYFLFRVSPRVELPDEQIQPKDIAFVVDTSGSMAGEKILQLKRALKFCIGSLRDSDRFNIYNFSTEVSAFREALVAAAPDVRQAATDYSEKLQALGGTNIFQALTAALKADPQDATRPYVIVFMTDGQPTVDLTNPEQILARVGQANSRNVRLHVFGVGSDVNTHLLDKLAEGSRGTRDYCDEREDLEIKLGGFVSRLSSPVLTDLSLSIDGLSVMDVYPKTLPDLFRGGEVLVLGRFETSPTTGRHNVRLSGRLRGETRTYEYSADFGNVSSQNDFLPRLWANRKVGYLLDQIRLHGRNQELVSEVIRLAKRFGIVTPYTSALIVEDTPRGLAAAPADRGFAEQAGRSAPKPRAVGGGRGGGAFRGSGGFSGEGAVAESRDLKKAKDGASLDDADSRRDKESLLRQVADKAFLLVDGRYVDSAWDGKLAPRKVKAYSDEYFELLREKPALAAFFALGGRVVVVLDGQAYETVVE
jgi:Ca-activated chloride channel homolog